MSSLLLPEINERLLPQLEKLKSGTRLLFHEYGLEGDQVARVEPVISNEDNGGHNILLYITRLKWN